MNFEQYPVLDGAEVLDPEEYKGYDKKADIWSLGITAIELAQGMPPYAREAPMKVIMLVLSRPSPHLPADSAFSKNFHEFIAACLTKDPHKRPTAQQLLQHKFLTQRRDAQYIIEALLAKLPPIGARYRQGKGTAAASDAEKLRARLASLSTGDGNRSRSGSATPVRESNPVSDSGEWDFEVDDSTGEKVKRKKVAK